ncbi:GTPase Era [bacterium]|nr:GTPase Era [bacterium]
MAHKAGFVNIVGKPNVGKSTLINELVGEKVAITTPKAQTTRHRILGLVNHDDYQIVLSDTPGIIDDPKYPMQNAMMDFVKEAWEDADVLLYLVEFGQKMESITPYLTRLKELSIPYFLVVNKIDKAEQEKLLAYMQEISNHIPQENIFPISALNKFNTKYLLEKIIELLPEHPAYYDKENYTDKTERFLVAEIIREKIFENFKQEIPYSVEVVVTTFKDADLMLRIGAEIYVNRKSQKGILIGKEGRALTRIGTEARRDLMNHYGKKVHLDLYVKVKEGWRESDRDLSRFGYKG